MYPILFFHGTPGNDHQANAFRAFSFTKIITYDRKHISPWDGPAHLLALSGGGPYALEYAATYPEKAKSLTLWSALTSPATGDFPPRLFGRILINTAGKWALKNKPFWIWKQWLKANTCSQTVYDHAINDHRSQGMFWQVLKSQIPFKLDRQLRDEIDFLKKYQFKHGQLGLPTMIVHDVNDNNVPLHNAESIQAHLTNLVAYHKLCSTGHLCFFGEQAQTTMKKWSEWIMSI